MMFLAPPIEVGIEDILPSDRDKIPGSLAALRPGRALLYECDTHEEQNKLQSRLSVRCKKANERSRDFHYRTLRRTSQDGVYCVYTVCEYKDGIEPETEGTES